MKLNPQHRKKRSGVVLVEFALVLPVILIILVGLLEVARMVQVKQAILMAVREGGRQASTGKRTTLEVIQVVKDYMSHSGYPTTNISVTVSNVTSAARADPAEANQMDQFQISATMPFDDVRWISLKWFTNGQFLTAQAVWPSMRDIPLTINSSVPID